MNLLFQYTHLIIAGVGGTTLAVGCIFLWQTCLLGVGYLTTSLFYMEKLSAVSTFNLRKVFVAPLVVSWKIVIICVQIILYVLSLILLYLVKYGTRILPVNPVTLYKIQQYGTPILMEKAPWGVKWVRNIYGGYLNWIYPLEYELLSTMYSLVFILSYLCRWLGYFVYLTYYYIIYLIRKCLLVICTPYVVEMLCFALYYAYRRGSYYLNVAVYKVSWSIYVAVRIQSYYLLPNLAIYYLRRFLNRNWQEWYFAENTQGDGQTPDFIYIDNPSPYMIQLFKQLRPSQLDECNGGLDYVLICIQIVLAHVWVICIILPLYICYNMLLWIGKCLVYINYKYITYYHASARLWYMLWEWIFTYENKKGFGHYLRRGIHKSIVMCTQSYMLLPRHGAAIAKAIMGGLFYIIYSCIWVIYYTPCYLVLFITRLMALLVEYRVPLLVICICYWSNYEYLSQILYILTNTIAGVFVQVVNYLPQVAGYVASIPSAFSNYDLIAHVAPQVSVGGAGYPLVTESFPLMERMPAAPYVIGYARYYQLYDLAYIHPRMKYWYSPVVYRWWDDLYYYYTDYIYAWLNLDPRARWMHLNMRLNTSVWKPYQVTRAWRSFGEWKVNWLPLFVTENSVWRSNLFVTTPSQEQAKWELEEPWSRVIHWPYGITRLNVGGYVDYHVGGRYLTRAISDYDAYSYVDIYRDGSAEAYEVWLIKQLQQGMVESNLKVTWPFFNELITSPALSRGDLLHQEGVQLQVVTYNSSYPYLQGNFYKQLVMWKWGFLDNMPDILRRRDKYTWLNHLGTLGGSWDMYKIYIYSKWLRPFHGTLYGMQDWAARGFVRIVWEVVNSRWMFWWQYSYHNITLRLSIFISLILHLVVIYPYMWVNFLWKVVNTHYTTFEILYNYLAVSVHWLISWVSEVNVQLYGYPLVYTFSISYSMPLLTTIYNAIYKMWVYLSLDTICDWLHYQLACYTWYVHLVYSGYIHILATSMHITVQIVGNEEPIMNTYITSSTQYNHSRIARYLDVLSSRQQLQQVLDWIYVQEPVAKVKQIVLQELVETEDGEWEDTVVIIDVNTTPVNPLADMGARVWEEPAESPPLQGPTEVELSATPWLHEVISIICNHKGYMLLGGYVCREIKCVIQLIFHMCVQLVHEQGAYIATMVKYMTPRYSMSTLFYLPIILFTKLQYWIDGWCVELQLPRRMQKYRLIYEYRRAGGHVKGHSQDLTYLRISPVRRSLLFSTYKWRPHNFMDYLQFVNSVQYTDPWWEGTTPYNGVKVAIGSEVSIGQHNFPTKIMFNYTSNIIRPLALSTILMYYITLFTLLLCGDSLSTLITCKQRIGIYNRQYAWDRFRTQPSAHLEWMFIPSNKVPYLHNYMNLTQKEEYKHLLFIHTLNKTGIVTNNQLLNPIWGSLATSSVSADTSYFTPDVYQLLSQDKYSSLCNNLIMPTDDFIKGVALGYSKDGWIGKVTGKEEEEDYVEWDQAFTYNAEYAKLHVDKFNQLYKLMFLYEGIYGNLPAWAWHKDPYNLRIFERYIAEDLTNTVSYVYEERVEDSPYIPWGAIAWGCIVPILLFIKPLVFMGKWWHHSNRPAHMLTQQFNFYMEEVLHHLAIMDYMAMFTPRDMINGKLGGHAHGTKPDLKRVYLLASESVYGMNFYTNYMEDSPIWLSDGKLLATAMYGGFNSSLEELRFVHLFNLLVVFIITMYIFKRARVQPSVKFTPISKVNYRQIAHHTWVKRQGQRFFTWFWR